MEKASPGNDSLAQILHNIGQKLNLDEKNPVDATAWFLGPKAENHEALLKFIKMAVHAQVHTRTHYMDDDPAIFIGSDKTHKESLEIIEKELNTLLEHLQGSIPLASYRNQSHMYWDITLPGIVGYFAAMLYNQNNVAAEASPVTTMLEIHVGDDLCTMLGFEKSSNEETGNTIKPWGHITCDGSIANGESMWAARNLKFLPVALAAAIVHEKSLEDAKSVNVQTYTSGRVRLIDLPAWELLNLPVDEVIGLVARIEQTSGVDADVVRAAVDKYSLQNTGLADFWRRFLDSYEQATPRVMVPDTAHYSWPKTGALLGLGTDSVKTIDVDLDGRMNTVALRQELDKCLEQRRPVLQVVAVLGSTEEGAIDPLDEIVQIREEYRQMGMEFVIHVDGAWGGYFTSMLRPSKEHPPGDDNDKYDPADIIDHYPELFLNDYFTRQFAAIPEVDSVTLDPHKSGFIPYPAGGLCYRNGAMRDLIAFTAPVVFHGGVDKTVGPYGIEGSKPGAAAASVYLSHKVIPLNKVGYGRLLGRCLFNSKRFYAALAAMDVDKDDGLFTITPFQRLPAEKEGATAHEIMEQKRYINEHLVSSSTENLIKHVFGLDRPEEKRRPEQKKSLALFQEIGSDLSIVAYAFNFRTAEGINTDLAFMNELNNDIFRALSLQPNETGKLPTVRLFVTASSFDPRVYGKELTRSFTSRAGLTLEDKDEDTPIRFLISTTQNPWLSTTSEENEMLDVVIRELAKAVDAAAEALMKRHGLKKP
jgi:glutamate/tyrosine decarboxylase-like PLP-dependent enzyme